MQASRILLFICAILAGCSGGSGSGQAPPPPAAALADIPALMEYYHVPGVSIAIVKDSKVDRLLVYGVSNQNTKEPVTASTRFQAGSISKPVAAVTALKFVQDGRIGLDENINDVLISWKLPSNSFTAIQNVSLRMLLNHTAGTTVHGFDGYQSTDQLPSLIQVLNGAPPANSAPIVVDKVPGQGYRYSGGGYVVMQQALIDLLGKPFATIAKETVLDPLAMTDSTYEQPLPAAQLLSASSAHDSNGNVLQGGSHIYPELAAAGLWTTPKDLALFLIELQLSIQGSSNQLISAALAAEMLSPPPGSTYGLGLNTFNAGGEEYFGHNGVNAGFQLAMLAHRSKGMAAVVMTNGDNGGPLIDKILVIIENTEHWPGF
jgi:CubicO group peptidase (beta-lactamase class C family)